MRLRRTLKALLIPALAAAGCKTTPRVAEVSGECADVFHGQVCTWARMRGSAVQAVGLSVPIAAIDSAPAEEAQKAWPPVAAAVLQLPETAQAQSGLTHFTMYWEAHGHPPTPYMVPHFDFHFYTIPSAQALRSTGNTTRSRASIASCSRAFSPALSAGAHGGAGAG